MSVILVGSNEDVDSYDGKQRHQYSTTPPRMFHANVMREDEQKMPQKTTCYLSLYCNLLSYWYRVEGRVVRRGVY